MAISWQLRGLCGCLQDLRGCCGVIVLLFSRKSPCVQAFFDSLAQQDMLSSSCWELYPALREGVTVALKTTTKTSALRLTRFDLGANLSDAGGITVRTLPDIRVTNRIRFGARADFGVVAINQNPLTPFPLTSHSKSRLTDTMWVKNVFEKGRGGGEEGTFWVSIIWIGQEIVRILSGAIVPSRGWPVPLFWPGPETGMTPDCQPASRRHWFDEKGFGWTFNILIIHASECISGSATCIEDIYNDANRTSRGGPASSVSITLWMSEIMLQLR